MEKYVVFSREDWLMAGEGFPDPLPVMDAVVIRTQDVFAEPALSSYANAVLTTVEILKACGLRQISVLNELTEIADYFMDKANEAHEGKRRLPDL